MFREKNVPRAAARLPLMWHLFDQFYRAILNLPSFQEKDSYSVVIASANSGEGASTIATNLAYAYAYDSTKNALLIDGNLRTPSLHNYFGVSREKGLTDLIDGTAGLDEALVHVQLDETKRYQREQATDAGPCFHFIPAGHSVPNPILDYQSTGFLNLMEQLRSMFSFIIFDASPLVRYPETSVLASKTDGLIMILEHDKTSREVAQVAKKYLEMTNAKIIGAILNSKQFYIPAQIYKYL